MPKKMTDAEKAKLKKDLKQVNLDKPAKPTTGEKTRALINRAYDLRTIKKVNATPAEKAKRNRQSLDAGKTATRAIAIANKEDKKKVAKAAAKKASYSPKPMSENDKKGAGFRGATTQWQIMLKKKDAAAAKAKKK